MSDADVVRRAFVASNGGDFETFLACLSDDVEWHSAGLFLYPADTYHGLRAVREALARTVERRGSAPRVTLRELLENGGDVLLVGTVSIPSSREHVTLPIGLVIQVRDERIARVTTFRGGDRARVEWRRRGGG